MPRTNAGRDWQSKIMGDTASNGSGTYAAANWIGVTTNATAPSPGSTTLTGEVASGSLVRAQAAFAHTTGASTYTLTKTFTSDQTITIAKFAVFNASSGGTMCFESLLSSPRTLAPGDSFQIIYTITI